MRRKATLFAAAATSQPYNSAISTSFWLVAPSQPRLTGSLRNALTATQLRRNEVSLDEMRWDKMSVPFYRICALCVGQPPDPTRKRPQRPPRQPAKLKPSSIPNKHGRRQDCGWWLQQNDVRMTSLDRPACGHVSGEDLLANRRLQTLLLFWLDVRSLENI